jgi:outer membrane protein TolC
MRYRHIIVSIILLISALSALAQVRTLDDFVLQGLSNSPLLKDLNSQIKTNTIDSLILKSTRYPKINFDGFYSYSPIINNYGYSEPITNGANFLTTINLSQPLFNKKTIEANYSKIGLTNQSLSNNIRITQNDLKKAIIAQYLTTYSIGNEISFKKAMLQTMNDEQEVLKRFAENGIFRQTDYLSFMVEAQGQRLLLGDLAIQYRRELISLNYLCGIQDTSVYDLPTPRLDIRSPFRRESSPYFQRFRIDSLSILNQKTLLDRNYKPSVRWFTDAGIVNNDPKLIYQNFGVSLGFSFSIPVYDGNQRSLNYEKLKTYEETRKNYQEYFNVQYEQQLRQLNDELEKTQALIPQIMEEMNLAEGVIRQYTELIQTGGISVTDYILAIRNYLSIQQYLNQYQVKILRIINEINYWSQ